MTRRTVSAGRMRHIEHRPGLGAAARRRSPALGDVAPWRLAVVLEGDDKALRIGLQPKKLTSGDIEAKRDTGLLLPVGLKWARRRGRSTLLHRAMSFMSSRSRASRGNIGCAKFRRSRAPSS